MLWNKILFKKMDFDHLILMDGDGEDRPEEIKPLIKNALDKKNISVVAKRIKDPKELFLQFFINLHKLITLIFTGRNMNFGNYSCLTRNDVKISVNKKSLMGLFFWNS